MKLDGTLNSVQSSRFRNKYHWLIKNALVKRYPFTELELEHIFLIYHKFVLANGNRTEYMTREQFLNIFHIQFDIQDTAIADRVLHVINPDSRKYVLPAAWLKLMRIYIRGSLERKIKFCFNVYDLYGTQIITKELLMKQIRKFLMTESQEELDALTNDMVDTLMRKMDVDRDGAISFDDYSSSVRKTPGLLEFLGQCLPRDLPLTNLLQASFIAEFGIKSITETLREDTLNLGESALHLRRQLASILELRKNKTEPEIHLSVFKAHNLFDKYDATLIKRIVDAKYDDPLIRNVSAVTEDGPRAGAPQSTCTKLIFKLDTDTFIQETLNESKEYSNLFLLYNETKRKFLVEYSSPNIAKPFHVGHLRSTIIGNFISNLFMYGGNNVIRLNYLGDWGTQFGLLKLGVEMKNLSDDEIRKNPIQSLYACYVAANEASKSDPTIAEKARNFFHQLETEHNLNDTKKWKEYRKYTVDELKIIYDRLGVTFDEYSWESQYGQQQIQNILNRLSETGILLEENDGRKIAQVGDRRVPIVKSDGSTLYLARDIAALMDRFKRYNFDKLFYVVDNAQTDHFNALFDISSRAESAVANRTKHIKFGRIKGMSTRSGNVVFLKDVLDEARDIMLQKQLQSPTTKVDVKNLDENVADILGVTAVIINDLKQRRQRDYDFDWSKALQVNGDTGIKLQYTHCRLCSLFENVPVKPAEIPNARLLLEPESIALITEIARFPEIIYKSEESLEACIVVNYLFNLSNAVSRALKVLNIKNQESQELQEQRMLLFSSAKQVLHDGMTILGIKPLMEM